MQIDVDNSQKQESQEDNVLPALHSLQSAKSIQNMQLDYCLLCAWGLPAVIFLESGGIAGRA